MVGKKKRVKAMKGKRVKAMGGKTMKGKRVKAMGGKKVGMGKRVKARKGKEITGISPENRAKIAKDVAAYRKDKREKDRAAKNDKSASKYYTDNPDMIEKHARTGSVGLFGAKKDLTDDMLRRDYKSGGGKMKKAGTRVKARGGNKIKKLAKGTSSGGIGAAASSAAEKASKDKGTKRGATSIASVNKMDRNKLKALLLEMLRQKNN